MKSLHSISDRSYSLHSILTDEEATSFIRKMLNLQFSLLHRKDIIAFIHILLLLLLKTLTKSNKQYIPRTIVLCALFCKYIIAFPTLLSVMFY